MCARARPIRMRAREPRSGPVDGRAPLRNCMPPLYGFSGFYQGYGGDTLDFTRESSLRAISAMARWPRRRKEEGD